MGDRVPLRSDPSRLESGGSDRDSRRDGLPAGHCGRRPPCLADRFRGLTPPHGGLWGRGSRVGLVLDIHEIIGPRVDTPGGGFHAKVARR